MNIQILKKFLSANVLSINNKSRINLYLNIFSFIITSLSIIFIVLILSVNEGFKKTVNNVIVDLNGKYKIVNKFSEDLTDDDESKILSLLPENTILSKVSTKDLIAKNKSFSEPINVIAFDNSNDFVHNLQDILLEGSISDSDIIIGKILSDKLNVSIGSTLILINIESNNIESIESLKVGGIFKSNIPAYDTYRIYGNRKLFKNFINENYDYFLTNDDFKNSLFNNKYLIKNIFQINDDLFKWLNAYDFPIKMLVFFIMLICIFNILQNNLMYVSYYKNDFFILKTLGLNNIYIYFLILLRSFLVLFLSSIVGFSISYILLNIEQKINLINLPDYVYFTDSIPIHIDYMLPFYIFPLLLIIMSIISLYFYNSFIKKYEF